ncbi:MAG: hypothetical protein AB198_01700 [Parcubacteria bacterium C7867-003]|nr:MAG: hypothetical protein AB198_01700 [Parcubacteria bacterium C7867-003]
MKLGSLQQKADWFLVGFVFGCIFIITILLYIMVRTEQKAEHLDSVSSYTLNSGGM